ncbi:MAG TPA: Rid family hydrolase [Acidimicrobiales bacterium]|nr:Rid family hydrolase [Acidimicrobiales bacterium]
MLAIDHKKLHSLYGSTINLCARDDLFALTGVLGIDPATNNLAPTPEEQFACAFANVERIADEVGLSLDEIGRITVFTPDASYRPLINEPWLRLFPNENRPARKTTHVPLAEGAQIELEIVGVLGKNDRQPIEIDGVRHKDPLPMGARLGRHVFSSVLVTDIPNSRVRPERLDAIKQVYENMTAFIEAAGGTLDDISNVWTYLGMWDLHPDYVDVWVEAFPDPASRPSRKTFYYPRVDIQLQCEAVIGGNRKNLEIAGIAHHDPIPMGAVTGGVFTSSGIDSRDPETKKEPNGVPAQAKNVMANLVRLLEQTNYRLDQLYHVTGLVGNRSYIPAFEKAFREVFPDPDRAPAWQVMPLGLDARDNLVQVVARGTSQAN